MNWERVRPVRDGWCPPNTSLSGSAARDAPHSRTGFRLALLRHDKTVALPNP